MSTWNIRVLFNHGVWHHFGCVDKNRTVSSFARKEDCYMYTKAVNWCFSWKQLSSSRVPYALETDEISYGQRQNEAKFRATILCLRRPGKSLRILAMRINRELQRLLKDYNIRFFATQNESNALLVKRFDRRGVRMQGI